MTSARPFDSASTVAKRWNTRTGSSELSTVTPEASRMREVRVAIPASTVSGVEIEYSGRWCSPSAIDVDAELVGQHRLVDDLPDRRARANGCAGVVLRHVAEGVEPEGQLGHLRTLLSAHHNKSRLTRQHQTGRGSFP